MLLYRTWHLQRGKTLEGDEGVGWNCQNHSVHLPVWRRRTRMMDRMSSSYCKKNRAETINEARTARRLVLARLTVEGTMGQGESQIGYLTNCIILYDGDASRSVLMHHRRAVAYMSCAVGAGYIDRRKRKASKFSDHIHRIPNADRVIDNDPRITEEFSGRVNPITQPVMVAYRQRPWKLRRYWERQAIGQLRPVRKWRGLPEI